MKAIRILISAILSVFLGLTAASQIIERRLAPIIATSEQGAPNIEPEWIRLDLAQDQVINEIVLYPLAEPLSERSALGLAPKDKLMDLLYKNPWLQKLTVKVSLDAWHWDTVSETNNLKPPKLEEPQRFSFLERPVKQIWIIGERLGILVDGPMREFWGHCWAIGEVQALGRGGNWALASRGTGVTTSSIQYGSQGKRQELEEWWSLHYDMGRK